MGVAVGKDQVCSRRGSSVGGEEGSCAVRGGESEGREGAITRGGQGWEEESGGVCLRDVACSDDCLLGLEV